MEIKLIRLKSKTLSKKNLEEDNNFIQEINDSLFDDDLILKEDVLHPLINVIFVESENIEKEFNLIKNEIINPAIIMVGHDKFALKGALEVNSLLSLEGIDPLLINDREAALLKELAKVSLMRSRVESSRIALIGGEKSSLDKCNLAFFENKYHLSSLRITKKTFEEKLNENIDTSLPRKEYFASHYKEEEILKIASLYHTLMFYVDNFHLDAISFALKGYDKYIGVVFSLLSEKGISCVSEGDLFTLVSLLTLNTVSETPAYYGVLSKIVLEKSRFNLIVKDVPFNTLNSESLFSKGDVTLYKISYDKKHIFATDAKIISSSFIDKQYVEVEFEIDDRRIFSLLNDIIGGSLAFSYGDTVGSLLAYDNILRIEDEYPR